MLQDERTQVYHGTITELFLFYLQGPFCIESHPEVGMSVA